MLAVTPTKAKFEPKKDYYVTSSTGFILFDFMPMLKNKPRFQNSVHGDDGPDRVNGTVKWTEKHSFIFTTIRAVSFLSIDPIKQQEMSMQFEYTTNNVPRKLSLKSDWSNKRVRITLEYDTENGHIRFTNHLSVGDILLIQKMIDYSIPFMQGWHALDVSMDIEQ